MVRLCMCACVCVCWCVSSEWIGEQEMCVDMRVIENERKRLSRGFFFSLSPSLLPEGQSLNPNVSQNKSIVFFWRLRHRATCRLLCNQTFQNSSEQQFFKLQIMPESTRFRDPFKLQLSDWNLKFYCAAMKYFCPPNFQVFGEAPFKSDEVRMPFSRLWSVSQKSAIAL